MLVIIGTSLLERAGVLTYGPVFAHVVFGGQRPPGLLAHPFRRRAAEAELYLHGQADRLSP